MHCPVKMRSIHNHLPVGNGVMIHSGHVDVSCTTTVHLYIMDMFIQSWPLVSSTDHEYPNDNALHHCTYGLPIILVLSYFWIATVNCWLMFFLPFFPFSSTFLYYLFISLFIYFIIFFLLFIYFFLCIYVFLLFLFILFTISNVQKCKCIFLVVKIHGPSTYHWRLDHFFYFACYIWLKKNKNKTSF